MTTQETSNQSTTQATSNRKTHCDQCAEAFPVLSPGHCGGTGYGVFRNETGAESTLCYSCCAEKEKQFMAQHGKTMLYFQMTKEAKTEGHSGQSTFQRAEYEVTDWAGKLRFPCPFVSRSKRPAFGGRIDRFDFWFMGPDGFVWHGYQQGHNNTIAHCKRTKKTKFV